MYKCSMDWNLLSWHKKFQKFIALSLEYIPIVFSYLQYFPAWKSLKSIWSLYNVYSTNFKNVFIKSFQVFLWNFFQNITGMPLQGHLLAARFSIFEICTLFSANIAVFALQWFYEGEHSKHFRTWFENWIWIDIQESRFGWRS